MCGINGFNWRNPELVRKMNSSVKHRGPDDEGIYVDDMVSLGHVRLSIIDLSSAGRQPMANEDGLIQIVYNGELYNFKDLRSDLIDKGHRFMSNTDTEVVIHSYEEYGPECIEIFNGMWAFAIYDKRRNLVFLSRDRFGIKPLYFSTIGDRFVFSSEIKGLLAHGIEPIPDNQAIFEYLAFGLLLDHSDRTFFRGIQRLRPGENLVYNLSDRSFQISRWYDVDSRVSGAKEARESEVISKVKELFVDCVEKRLVADVPVGSCLSGGIDSSSIVSIMRSAVRDDRIETFSMVFPGLSIDESDCLDEIVKSTNVRSHRVIPNSDELVDELSDLVWTQEEPFPSLSMYGQYRVLKLASNRGMKVLLDGQGGDEILAGYPYYYVSYLIESLIHLRFRNFFEALKSESSRSPQFLKELLSYVLEGFGSYWRGSRLIKRVYWRFLKDFEVEGGRGVDDTAQVGNRFMSLDRRPGLYHALRSVTRLNSALLFDLKIRTIPSLLRFEDKNSMRWGVESRLPFLDYRFVEFLFTLPSRYKIRGWRSKYVLREAMAGTVPDRILMRRDKVGFETPDREWMRSRVFTDFAQKLFASGKFKSRPYWNAFEAAKILESNIRGDKDWTKVIWRIVNVELWNRIFIDGSWSPG